MAAARFKVGTGESLDDGKWADKNGGCKEVLSPLKFCDKTPSIFSRHYNILITCFLQKDIFLPGTLFCYF